MKAVLILALIGVCMILVSLIRLGVQVKYGPDELSVRIRVGPLSLTVLPQKEKKTPHREKPAEKQEVQRKYDIPGVIRRALPVVLEWAGRLRRKIRLDRIWLDVAAGSDDPAAAALAFGGINAALGMTWPLVEQNFNVKDRRIRTKVDFSAPLTQIWLDGAATLTVGQALSLALWLVPRLPGILRTKQEKTDGKQTEHAQKEAV